MLIYRLGDRARVLAGCGVNMDRVIDRDRMLGRAAKLASVLVLSCRPKWDLSMLSLLTS